MDPIMTTSEVAAEFGVSTPTVIHWCKKRALPYFLTPAGDRRFYRKEIRQLIDGSYRGVKAGEFVLVRLPERKKGAA